MEALAVIGAIALVASGLGAAAFVFGTYIRFKEKIEENELRLNLQNRSLTDLQKQVNAIEVKLPTEAP